MAQRLELGLGALEVLSKPGAGCVVGVYSKAAYLRLPGGLVALTSFDVPSGPVHARCTAPLHRLRVGDGVTITESFLQAGPILLELATARVWKGPLPASGGLRSGRRLALDLLAEAPASVLGRELADSAGSLLSRGDIDGAVRCLGGVGPGLTPAGDDCLAGILLIAGIGRAAPGLPALTELASTVETNDLARVFLHWAALGQSIEPVHRFLISAGEGDFESAELALKEVTTLGHSSGADLALGLELGLGCLISPSGG